uniref:Uncharacterized protein n=1 Tax=viral metagenome TaxID=1070528 RepID=A0A6M3KIA9_9ZZZZ
MQQTNAQLGVDTFAMQEYLAKFREEARGVVYENIFKGKAIANALSRPEIRIIFEEPRKRVVELMMAALQEFIFSEKLDIDSVNAKRQEARAIIMVLQSIEGQIVEAAKHLEKIKKKG